MRIRLKPLSRQVMVITGASSGIGLVTARMAARQGATVVVAARNAPALHRLAREIEEQGGQSLAVPTDVTHDNDVRRLCEAAVRRFGGSAGPRVGGSGGAAVRSAFSGHVPVSGARAR